MLAIRPEVTKKWDNRKIKEIKYIHTRKERIFAGLIVAPSVKWPTWINDEFKRHHESVELYARNEEISLVDLALGWVKSKMARCCQWG